MSYGFIKHTLIGHFPYQDDAGYIECACGWASEGLEDVEGQWAEHVEVAYNAVHVVGPPLSGEPLNEGVPV